MANQITDETKCERCGIPRKDTEMNVLAYHGAQLVCEICDSELNEIEAAERECITDYENGPGYYDRGR